MNQTLLDSLPRPLREAVESAGYRVLRWAAARELLQTRVTKGRIAGELGEFLTHWLSAAPAHVIKAALNLDFIFTPEQLWLTASPFERALLHLPALRGFWRNELRQQHFAALQAIVPPAWLMDAAVIPHGAVVHGLGISSWDQLDRVRGADWQLQNQILTRNAPVGMKLSAQYERNDQGQVVLRSVAATS